MRTGDAEAAAAAAATPEPVRRGIGGTDDVFSAVEEAARAAGAPAGGDGVLLVCGDCGLDERWLSLGAQQRLLLFFAIGNCLCGVY